MNETCINIMLFKDRQMWILIFFFLSMLYIWYGTNNKLLMKLELTRENINLVNEFAPSKEDYYHMYYISPRFPRGS